jgi:hypothetical protein
VSAPQGVRPRRMKRVARLEAPTHRRGFFSLKGEIGNGGRRWTVSRERRRNMASLDALNVIEFARKIGLDTSLGAGGRRFKSFCPDHSVDGLVDGMHP